MAEALRILIAAGEASGDALAAELVETLQNDPEFHALAVDVSWFGAAGPRLQAAGVEPVFDLTRDAVVGLWEAGRRVLRFKSRLDLLCAEAELRRPHLVLVIDNSGFNLRLLEGLREAAERTRNSPREWRPRHVYFISPQVWASRSGRVRNMARTVDLLLSIFPFEKDWYGRHAPEIPVEFVGHPIVDRFPEERERTAPVRNISSAPQVLLLPGSRSGELARHLPVMNDAVGKIRSAFPGARFRLGVPDAAMAGMAAEGIAPEHGAQIESDSLAEGLRWADLAVASSGTVTLECAWFGVPTLVMYKTSWLTYEVGRRLVKVPFLAMPNLLAGQAIFPEFIQAEATGAAIGRTAVDWLGNPEKRREIQDRLAALKPRLGPPGACRRAATAIVRLLRPSS